MQTERLLENRKKREKESCLTVCLPTHRFAIMASCVENETKEKERERDQTFSRVTGKTKRKRIAFFERERDDPLRGMYDGCVIDWKGKKEKENSARTICYMVLE